MIAVRLNLLLSSIEEIRKEIQKLEQQIDQSARIISSLGRLSGYDSLLAELWHIRREMEEEREHLREMKDALERILAYYFQGEKNILEFGGQIPF